MKQDKYLIIFNPKAGFKYLGDYKNYFIKNFKTYLPSADYYWLETSTNLANQLKKINFREYKRIIIIGGDGTIKITADYILKNKIDLPLAIIPQGSANVLAGSLNIPILEKKAIKVACLGYEKLIDVCLLNKKHYFIIGLSVGFLSKIINETERGLKIKLGFFAYLITFLKQKKIYQADFHFKLDGQEHLIKGNTLIIANSLSLLKLKPACPIDFYDGKFDVFITKNKTFLGILASIFFIFASRKWLPYIFKSQGKKIEVEYISQKIKTVQIDGEKITVDKIEVEIIPKKLHIITQ